MPYARSLSKLLLVIVVSLVAAPAARAITDEEIFRQMRFNFINPGARALGLGGAFIAVADDATAAQANPAGLMQLAAPEFFVEERFVERHSASGESPPGFFTFSSENENRAVTTPTFFSYVYPWKHLALGLSRQELMTTRVSTQSVFDVFGAITWTGTGAAAVDVTNWNATLAWRPVSWIAFGGTATLAQFRIDSTVQNSISDPGGLFLCHDATGTGGGPIDCDLDNNGTNDPANTIPALQHPQNWYGTSIDDSNTDVTYSLGILVTPWEKFSGGLVFRKGPSFQFEQKRTDGLSSAVASATFAKPDAVFTHTMDLPNTYGVGLKWRPNENLTVAADVVRIKYSRLLDNLLTEQNVLTGVINPATTGGSFATDFTIDDATEYHVGAEYFFTKGKWPISVRAGVFNDPDNVMRDRNGQFGDALGGRADKLHYTVGGGVVVQQKFQADVALSLSSIGNEGLVSFIYRY
jgi:long-chain fatty acid transport protein